MRPAALTIAGSDPSGGAGVQADLKTFHQFGVYGMAALTLLTVQNTTRVSAVEPLDPRLVRDQLDAVVEDIPPAAAKTGALGTAGIIEAVADWARGIGFPLVVDPVMISKHGAALVAEDAREALAKTLLSHCFLVTPNLHEAAALAGIEVNGLEAMEHAARRIAARGARAVLVKGGHLQRDATDVLYFDERIEHFPARRIDSPHTHGTGCTYSAAITAELAKGKHLLDAIATAKRFVTEAIASAPGLGRGNGPVNHFVRVE